MQTTGPSGTGQRADDPAAGVAEEPEALVVTRMFDPVPHGDAYDATIRFTGHRVGGTEGGDRRDEFVHDERVEGIVPGSGPASVTAYVYGLRPGRWMVTAEIVGGETIPRAASHARATSPGARPLRPVTWSWKRWSIAVAPEVPETTRWSLLAPLARIPAVAPGAYTLLAVLGIAIALASQAAILATESVDASGALAVSLVSLVAGLAGAKAWYRLLHPTESLLRGGWAVDGFLVVAPVVATAGLLLAGLPIGRVLDATAPGLFFAVAIGRVGCLLAGCCAGRWTAARWGLWASDRRVGARRIPTQLMESGTGIAIGLAALLLVLAVDPPVHGGVFILSLAAYAAVRQALLRLRAERRAWSTSIPLTAGAAAAALAIVAIAAVVQAAATPAFG